MYQSINLTVSSNFTHRSLSPLFTTGIRKPINLKPLCVSSDPNSPNPKTVTQNLISLLRIVPDWADEIKERGMQQKRSLYTHEKWVEHRSSLRHVRHLVSSFSSRVILSLIPPVFFFTSVAIVIASYNSAVALDWLPSIFSILQSFSLPYQLTAPALAFHLVLERKRVIRDNAKETLVKSDSSSDYGARIRELVKQDGHELDSFGLDVFVPSTILENERAVM